MRFSETAGLSVPGAPRPLRALCVVPIGMEEGTEADASLATSEGIFVYDNGFGVDVTMGDVVRIEETKPISKTKTWTVKDRVVAGGTQAVEADLDVEAANN